jgi:hypothetical protein
MSKYTLAKSAIAQMLDDGAHAGIGTGEVLSALIVSAVDHHTREVGREETRVLLTYELDNLGGTLDMVNLRAR